MSNQDDNHKNRDLTQYERIDRLSTAELGGTLISKTPLLKHEDRNLFHNVCATVLGEQGHESIVDFIDANDFAYRLVEEQRYREAIAATFEQARKQGSKNLRAEEGLREELISHGTIDRLEKLTKLQDNSMRDRRAIGNEIRKRTQDRKKLAPPVTHDPPLPVAADHAPPITHDHEPTE